jgi:hypothetical protein
MRKFRRKFHETACPSPSGDTSSKLVKEVQTHEIFNYRRPLKRNRVLMKTLSIGLQLENSPRKSMRRLEQQSSVSVDSA